ncbi:ABC-2 transporter permease [Facklamia sp. 7083-14-GEN3]|uniref:ABC-2 transporter permease n=1 Tax=Facklamia sp. 7083-14-GEN3 TaxID=2973478 RepID=UPI00215CBDE6|nr:ABC-2 transporter permease [Facklamia sp. 7083-14-GEN3]MCR8969356.1 ABC-2 transporter permease [Facklamia sp. 7083-14-GEN3]
MKGLLYKDWLLIQKTKLHIFVPIIIIFIIFYIKSSEMALMSVISVSILSLILPTITYDESENGMPMLLTLPYSREDYVHSKYFSLIIGLIGLLVFEVCLTSLVAYFQNPQTFNFIDNLLTILMILAVSSILVLILLPIQLKFGSEGTLLIILSFLVLCIFSVIFFLFNEKIISADLYRILKNFFSNKWSQLFTSILAMSITYFASINISMKIMKRREY